MTAEAIADAIFAAISARFAIGTTEADKKAIADAYEGLKSFICKKFGVEGSLADAIQMLELKPDSESRKQTLIDELRAVDPVSDHDLTAAALSLLEVIPSLSNATKTSNISLEIGNAQVVAQTQPNLPLILEMEIPQAPSFIETEPVEGVPLDQLIAVGDSLDLITKLSIIEQVCSGLRDIHQKGIIHRDIQPANVIVQPNGVAKIINLGIKPPNQDLTSGLTRTGEIIGSLHYIAPERFKGEAVDGRVDIFAAGVLMSQLLTGHLPFAGEVHTAAYRLVNEPHEPLATYLNYYPPALDAILDRALAKNPGDRFQHAEDFADALHGVIEELKKTRVLQLFDDAERLTTKFRFAATSTEPVSAKPGSVSELLQQLSQLSQASYATDVVSKSIELARAALLKNEADKALSALKGASEMVELVDTAKQADWRRYVQATQKALQQPMSASTAGAGFIGAIAIGDALAAKDSGGITRLIQRLTRVLREAPPKPVFPASTAPAPPLASSGPGEFTRMISGGAVKAAAGAAAPPPASAQPVPAAAAPMAPLPLPAPAMAPPAFHTDAPVFGAPEPPGAPFPPPTSSAPGGLTTFLKESPKAAATKSGDTTLVSVFYATDRMQLPTLTLRTQFGKQRSLLGNLHYGRCEVSIPRTHKLGNLESPSILRLEFRPDPAKHIVLSGTFSVEEREFFELVNASVARSAAKDAFVFVHGYNVSFENAARRTGQMAFDLNFVGAPIFYSWPSNGKTADYPKDETNITWSTPHLQRFLNLLAQNTSAKRIYVIAHSMGNRAVCDALKMISFDSACGLKLTHLVLAAPDIDADTFRELATMLQKLSARITLYESSKDIALLASKKIHGNPRAGEPLLVIPGLDTIDASAIDTDFLGHSYFSDTWPLLSDIHSILFEDQPPERRFGLAAREDPAGKYYAFRA